MVCVFLSVGFAVVALSTVVVDVGVVTDASDAFALVVAVVVVVVVVGADGVVIVVVVVVVVVVCGRLLRICSTT